MIIYMGVLIVNKKDTYVYELKDGNTIVYCGISDQLSEREELEQLLRQELCMS